MLTARGHGRAAVPGSVVVVVTHGFGAQGPGPMFRPPNMSHSNAFRNSQLTPSGNASSGEPVMQH